jgi:hypothetical protein
MKPDIKDVLRTVPGFGDFMRGEEKAERWKRDGVTPNQQIIEIAKELDGSLTKTGKIVLEIEEEKPVSLEDIIPQGDMKYHWRRMAEKQREEERNAEPGVATQAVNLWTDFVKVFTGNSKDNSRK